MIGFENEFLVIEWDEIKILATNANIKSRLNWPSLRFLTIIMPPSPILS